MNAFKGQGLVKIIFITGTDDQDTMHLRFCFEPDEAVSVWL